MVPPQRTIVRELQVHRPGVRSAQRVGANVNRVIPVLAFELRSRNRIQDYRIAGAQRIAVAVRQNRLGGSARKERGKGQSEDQKNMVMLHKIVNCS